MSADDTTRAAEARAQPQQIDVRDALRTLTITWADGHISRYPFWYLRGFCPCAVCQGHGGALTFHGGDVGDGPKLNTIDDVGHYAINLTWDDGHKTGIYTLDGLRNLCPCPVCQNEPKGRALVSRLPQSRLTALRALS
jgi:DUF971 family protein